MSPARCLNRLLLLSAIALLALGAGHPLRAAAPTLTSIAPSAGTAGATSFSLTLTGTNFNIIPTNDVINFNGTPLTTQTINTVSPTGTSLTATVTLPATVGSGTITLTTPGGGGGTSNPVAFTINAPDVTPTLTSVSSSPSSALAGTGATLHLTGTHFTTGTANTITLTPTAGGAATTYTATAATTTSLTTGIVTLPAAGSYDVTVTNANGGPSNPVAFTVNALGSQPPTVTITAPAGGAAFTAPATITVTATATDVGGTVASVQFFQDGAALGAPDTAAPYSATTAALPAGTYTFTAEATSAAGAVTASRAVTVTVTNPAPTLNPGGVTPTTGTANSAATLTLAGTGFTTDTANTVTFTSGSGTVYTFASATAASAASLQVAGTLPPAGAYTVNVTNANGTTATGVAFTVTAAPAPTLSAGGVSANPASAVTGTNVTLTLTGTGFTTGTANTVTLTGTTGANAGVATTFGSAVASAGGTNLTLSGTLPQPADTYTVTVTNANGTTATGRPFTVNPVPVPTLSGVSATSTITGTSTTLTLTGTNFTTGSANTVTLTSTAAGSSPITFGSVTAGSATSLALSGTLPATGNYTVNVSNVNGATGPAGNPGVAFTVTPGVPPSFTGPISPNSGITGTTVTLTLTGSHFLSTSNAVLFTPTSSGPAIAFGSAGSSDGNTLVVTGTLPAAGAYTVAVQNVNGTNGTVAFTVNPVPTPTLATISPNSGLVGTGTALTLTGTNFTAFGNTVTFTGTTGTNSGVPTVFASSAPSSAGGTTLNLTGTIPQVADVYNVTVTNQFGKVSAEVISFTANNPVPIVTSLSPATGPHNTTVTVTITGTGFVVPTSASDAATGSTVTITPAPAAPYTATVINTNQISVANLQLPNAGQLTFTVTNPAPNSGSGTQNTAVFTVNPPPTVSGVTSNPPSAIAGASVTLSLTGTGFTTGTANTVDFTAPDGTVLPAFGSANATSATSLTVSGILPSSSGNYVVNVSNLNGVTGPGMTPADPGTAFTVNNPVPALTNLTPQTGAAGSTVTTLIITGTGFLMGAGGSTVQILSTDGTTPLTPAGTVVNSATQITVTGLALPAAPGTVTVTVTNPGQPASNPLVFQVSSIAPTISSISSNPAAATSGATVKLTIIGTNFLPASASSPTPNTVVFTDASGNAFTFGSNAAADNTNGTALNVEAALPATPGTYFVTVQNANGPSNAFAFTVNNPSPTISTPGLFQSDGITAYTGDTISKTVTLIIQGTGFLSSSVVSFVQNGVTYTPTGQTVTTNSPTQITVSGLTLPPSVGVLSIAVINPAPGGGTSAAAQFNVVNPQTAITSLVRSDSTPINKSVVNDSIGLKIIGAGFVSTSTPSFSFAATGSSAVSVLTPAGFTIDSSTQITINSLKLPATPGQVSVIVANPGQPASNTLRFSVNSQAPQLDSISPASLFVGDAGFTTLTVNSNKGTFATGSIVLFEGAPLTTTFNSVSVLTAAVSPAVTQAVQKTGQYPVTVQTPNGTAPVQSNNAILLNVLPLGPAQKNPNGLATEYFSATAASGKNGLLLFSVPYDYSGLPIDPSVGSTVLEDVDPGTLTAVAEPLRKFAVWDPSADNYDLTNAAGYDPNNPQAAGNLANALVLGRGYWGRFPDPSVTAGVAVGLTSRGKTALDASLAGLINNGRFTISLHPGWNMIGDPWAEPEGQTAVGVPLQNMQIVVPNPNNPSTPLFTGALPDASTQGLVSPDFYQYDSAKNAYSAVSSLTTGTRILPYVGYWVHAYRDCTLLVPQP